MISRSLVTVCSLALLACSTAVADGGRVSGPPIAPPNVPTTKEQAAKKPKAAPVAQPAPVAQLAAPASQQRKAPGFVSNAAAKELIHGYSARLDRERKKVILSGRIPKACVGEIGVIADSKVAPNGQVAYAIADVNGRGAECLRKHKADCEKPAAPKCASFDQLAADPKTAAMYLTSVSYDGTKAERLKVVIRTFEVTKAPKKKGAPAPGQIERLEAIADCDCSIPPTGVEKVVAQTVEFRKIAELASGPAPAGHHPPPPQIDDPNVARDDDEPAAPPPEIPSTASDDRNTGGWRDRLERRREERESRRDHDRSNDNGGGITASLNGGDIARFATVAQQALWMNHFMKGGTATSQQYPYMTYSPFTGWQPNTTYGLGYNYTMPTMAPTPSIFNMPTPLFGPSSIGMGALVTSPIYTPGATTWPSVYTPGAITPIRNR